MNRAILVFVCWGFLVLQAETGAASGEGNAEPSGEPPGELPGESQGGLPEEILSEDRPELEAERPETDGEADTPAAGVVKEKMWMDHSQEWVTETLFRRLVWFDSMFYESSVVRREDPRSRFRMKVFQVMNLKDSLVVEPDAEFSASVRLPGLRDRFRIVLDSEELDAFPGRGPEDKTSQSQLSLRRMGSWLDVDLGAKVSDPPRVFTRMTTRQQWGFWGKAWSASQRGFYDTDEGFGLVGNVSQHLWPHRHVMVGHTSSVRWSESTKGVEWQDSLMLAYVPTLIEPERHGGFLGHSDMADCLGLRLRVRGQDDGSHSMSSYLAGLIYRRKLFERDYLYLEIVPEVEWNQDNDWAPEYTLRMGFDILFWRDM